MFFLKVLIFALLFYFILNFSQIKQRRPFQMHSLILPFSLSIALTLVDSVLKVAFYYSFLLFLLISGFSYWLLSFFTRDSIKAGKEESDGVSSARKKPV